MVELLRSLERSDSDYVFLSARGRRLKSIKNAFQDASRQTGILNFRFHDLRHTFASHFIVNGGDLITLKEILGHSSMKMVERYAYLAAAYKRRQVNSINGMFSKRPLYASSETPPICQFG
jgi:integrase